jgi:hypothetical protein
MKTNNNNKGEKMESINLISRNLVKTPKTVSLIFKVENILK